jgi:membrane protein
MKKIFSSIYDLLKQTISNFAKDRVLKLSAALAYYTIFALPPLLLMLISITGIFYGEDAIRGKVFGQINGLVGDKAALQIQEMIKTLHLSGDTQWATIVAIVTLILGASGIFGEIQDSINLIWGLKVKPKKGLIKIVINRLISFSLIISIGFVMLVALIINGFLALLSDRMNFILEGVNVNLLLIVDYLLQFSAITVFFASIFKVLPDAKIAWKDVTIGALVTSVLFIAGKFIIGYYLSSNRVITAYGATGSIILVLVWVYYSAAILYFGAEFTQVYVQRYGSAIKPNRYAVWVENKLIERKKPVKGEGEPLRG